MKRFLFGVKRKVALIGPSTLMISLPSAWVKKHGVEKGHEIDVEERDGGLLVQPRSVVAEQKQHALHLQKKDQFLHRYLRQLYHKGVHEVKVVCDEGIDVKDIKKELDLYLGFEIIEHGKKYCVVRNVAETLEGEFDAVLRKLFLMNQSMAEESLHFLKTGEYDGLQELIEIERTNNKLVNLSYRTLHKSVLHDAKKMSLATVLFCLENIADHFRDVFVCLQHHNIHMSKGLYDFYVKIVDHYKQLAHLYYAFDASHLVGLRDQRVSLLGIGHSLFGHLSKQEGEVLHHILLLLQQMKDLELGLDFSQD